MRSDSVLYTLAVRSLRRLHDVIRGSSSTASLRTGAMLSEKMLGAS